VQLPQIAGRDQDNAGEVIEAVISLSDAQLDEIKAVITRPLIKAVQELTARIEELENGD
jgi:hypothetical protein